MSDGLPNISGEGLSTEDFFSPEYSEMNEFRYCIGTPPSRSYAPADAAAIKNTRTMFKAVLARNSLYRKPGRRGNEASKFHSCILESVKANGHTFARQLSRLGGGTYHTIQKISCLPKKHWNLFSMLLKKKYENQWLSAEGFRVLRFWNTEVLINITGVLERIRQNCLNTLP